MSDVKIKTYGELEISETLSDASHIVIEENGDVKRFPANGIGKIKTVNGIEPDENGDVAVEIPSFEVPAELQVGKVLAGQTVRATYEDTNGVVAGEGASIFGDFRERTYSSSGYASTGNIAAGIYSHAEGNTTTASGENSHAEGWHTTASGNNSHAEGCNVTASGVYAHAEGYNTIASGTCAHAEGYWLTASGEKSHAEGNATTASGESSHAEGYSTQATGEASHAEGYTTQANGKASHAEGEDTIASGELSHAEGYNTSASGKYSHAEGKSTAASGEYSHAEGNSAYAYGLCSHVEGECNSANTAYLHVAGTWNLPEELPDYVFAPTVVYNKWIYKTETWYKCSEAPVFNAETGSCDVTSLTAIAIGDIKAGDFIVSSQDNITDYYEVIAMTFYNGKDGAYIFNLNHYESVSSKNVKGKYAHVVGNGTSATARSNAHTLDWDGNAWFAGGIELNSPDGTRYRITVADGGILTVTAVTE